MHGQTTEVGANDTGFLSGQLGILSSEERRDGTQMRRRAGAREDSQTLRCARRHHCCPDGSAHHWA